MAQSYPIPEAPAEAVIEIKKSRFIARAAHISSKQEAKAMLEQARRDYPDARHHCWAYQLGNPVSASQAAMNDAGEPSGTAGKPILNVLQHKGVGDVMIVVIRYFGGIKLGAGGLTRAYSAAAQAVMNELKTTRHQAMQDCRLQCDFSQEQCVRHWLETHQVQLNNTQYFEQVHLEILCPLALISELEKFTRQNNIKLSINPA